MELPPVDLDAGPNAASYVGAMQRRFQPMLIGDGQPVPSGGARSWNAPVPKPNDHLVGVWTRNRRNRWWKAGANPLRQSRIENVLPTIPISKPVLLSERDPGQRKLRIIWQTTHLWRWLAHNYQPNTRHNRKSAYEQQQP